MADEWIGVDVAQRGLCQSSLLPHDRAMMPPFVSLTTPKQGFLMYYSLTRKVSHELACFAGESGWGSQTLVRALLR